MSANNGGPAFPGYGMTGRGMTLRDYFAAKAMQGILSNPSVDYMLHDAAQRAYEAADAMIAARGDA